MEIFVLEFNRIFNIKCYLIILQFLSQLYEAQRHSFKSDFRISLGGFSQQFLCKFFYVQKETKNAKHEN